MDRTNAPRRAAPRNQTGVSKIRPNLLLAFGALVLCCAAFATAREEPLPIPPSTETPASAPTTQPVVPYGELLDMYRAELGPLFRPPAAERIYAAHQMLERYFAGSAA